MENEKAAFGVGSVFHEIPPPPSAKFKMPGGTRSQFYSQFTPSLGPSSESTAITLYRRAKARIACGGGKFVTLNRTQSFLVIFGSEEPSNQESARESDSRGNQNETGSNEDRSKWEMVNTKDFATRHSLPFFMSFDPRSLGFSKFAEFLRL